MVLHYVHTSLQARTFFPESPRAHGTTRCNGARNEGADVFHIFSVYFRDVYTRVDNYRPTRRTGHNRCVSLSRARSVVTAKHDARTSGLPARRIFFSGVPIIRRARGSSHNDRSEKGRIHCYISRTVYLLHDIITTTIHVVLYYIRARRCDVRERNNKRLLEAKNRVRARET